MSWSNGGVGVGRGVTGRGRWRGGDEMAGWWFWGLWIRRLRVRNGAGFWVIMGEQDLYSG